MPEQCGQTFGEAFPLILREDHPEMRHRHEVFANPAGVAPCVETQIDATTLFNLPGPPREVEALFRQYLEAPIAQLYSGTRALVRVAVNLPESECGPILHSVMELHPNTYLKAFVALSEKTADGQRLPVDIVAWGQDDTEAQALLDRTLNEFKLQAAKKGSGVEIDKNDRCLSLQPIHLGGSDLEGTVDRGHEGASL